MSGSSQILWGANKVSRVPKCKFQIGINVGQWYLKEHELIIYVCQGLTLRSNFDCKSNFCFSSRTQNSARAKTRLSPPEPSPEASGTRAPGQHLYFYRCDLPLCLIKLVYSGNNILILHLKGTVFYHKLKLFKYLLKLFSSVEQLKVYMNDWH